MEFENDIFISYSHIDNKAEDGTDNGWITMFHTAVENRLEKFLGKVTIWRDPKLSGNEIFTPAIESRLPKNKVMISVITPNYIRSDWCKREIDGFYKAAVEKGELSIGTKSRIFKVVPNPVDDKDIEALPEDFHFIFRKILDYQFYKKEGANNKIITFEKSEYDKEIEKEYYSRLGDVVNDVKELIKQINDPGNSDSGKKKIYLAETTSDLNKYRDELVRELKEANYTVLPDKKLPIEINDFTNDVKGFIDQSILSVHLISSTNYAFEPEGADNKSAVILQNEFAAQKSAAGNFPRMIWIPPTTAEAVNKDKVSPQQVEFLTKLRNAEDDAQLGADIFEGTLQEFNTEILKAAKKITDADEKAKQDALKAAEEKAKKPVVDPTIIDNGKKPAKLVYLICFEPDLKTTRPLEKLISKNGYTVLLPNFDRGNEVMLKEHEDNLKICDAVIIYYGAGDYRWFGKMIGDLVRLKREPSSPPLEKVIYIAAPEDDDKKDIDPNGLSIIDGLSSFDPEKFNGFFQKLK